jgi:tRNA-binding protein
VRSEKISNSKLEHSVLKNDKSDERGQTISWKDFERVDIRVGTIIGVEPFPEARKPAWKLKIDFGHDIGIKNSSAQATKLYQAADLLGRQIVAVINFPPKQIGPFMSEVLVTGFPDGSGGTILAAVERSVPNGARLF